MSERERRQAFERTQAFERRTGSRAIATARATVRLRGSAAADHGFDLHPWAGELGPTLYPPTCPGKPSSPPLPPRQAAVSSCRSP